ncbi:MAG TPA: alpha-hydroxy acid oxidase, partial [Burkholderiaceae bacterium]|nr:alpha-hydroxy acid oxidase [Burkholderiaceae bacterium]
MSATWMETLRSLARERLDAAVWQHLEHGAGDGLTAQANRAAFDRRPIVPRPLAPVAGGHTRLQLFGCALDHPLLLAPIAYQCLFHPEGEVASALAAQAQGGVMIAGTLASQPWPQINAAHEGRGWFQLYWQGGRGRTERVLAQARAAGFSVLVFTVDAPVKEVTFSLPATVRAVNLEGDVAPPAGASAVFDGWMRLAPSWEDFAWLRAQWPGPLLIKGVLHPQDARRAVDLGADGVIVSNHGGRVLDGAPASLEALPAIVDAVAGRARILLDSGVRSGRDAFRALAAGADAVLIGRPYVWALACEGAAGVARLLRA